MKSRENVNFGNKKFHKKDDIIELQLSNDEKNKFYLYIYISKNKSSIIFKIKELNISDSYYYEKYDLRDFGQNYKKIISDENIEEAYRDIKNIIYSHKTDFENKNNVIKLFFQKENDEEDIIFILRKKNIQQNRINQILIEKINENFKKLNNAQNILDNYGESIDNHSNIINNIYDKLDNINDRIQNLLNEINNNFTISDTTKENTNKEIKIESKEQEKEKPKSEGKLFYSIKYKFCNINILFFSTIILFIFSCYLFNLSNIINNEIDFIIKQDKKLNERMPIYEYILGISKKQFFINDDENDNITLEFDKNGKIKSKYNSNNNFIINRYYKYLNDKKLNSKNAKNNNMKEYS